MDQKVTNQAVLGELDARGVRFLTLRMRSAALIRHINSLTSKDYKTITLDRPSPHNKPNHSRTYFDVAAMSMAEQPHAAVVRGIRFGRGAATRSRRARRARGRARSRRRGQR